MNRLFLRAGITGLLTAGALAVPLASSAAANPLDGGYCSVFLASGSCTATWYADVTGEYGGMTYGSWEVDVQQTVNGASTWSVVASGGPGEFSSAPGALQVGNTYRLVITGSGGGMIGSATGTNTF